MNTKFLCRETFLYYILLKLDEIPFLRCRIENIYQTNRIILYSMKVFLFPGQGTQFAGMGEDLYKSSSKAEKLFQEANEILVWDIDQIRSERPEEYVNQTRGAIPVVLIYAGMSCLDRVQ